MKLLNLCSQHGFLLIMVDIFTYKSIRQNMQKQAKIGKKLKFNNQ